MKKALLIAMAVLAFSCSSDDGGPENPAPPAKPGTGDIASLTDGDIETYYESDGENVAIVLTRDAATKVVSYSLYSTGDLPSFDPKAWNVLGSNDGTNWTQVDTRSDQSFFARYQEHLFHLAAEANYKNYKFELQPAGGKTLKLAEIVFHTENPDKGWEDFTPPTIVYQNTAPGTKGSEYYNLLVQDKTRYLQYHAKQVAKLLYFSAADQKTNGTPVSSITYELRDYDGVSYKAGSAPHIQIVYSTRHIENSYATSMFKLDFETKGVLFHEMTHAYQLEPKGIPGYSEPNTSWQIIEGMADAIRAHANFFPWTNRTPGGYWQNGYQRTGFFLEWLTTKDADALRKINGSMVSINPWSFDKAMVYTFGEVLATQSPTDELWTEYQTAISN